MNTVTLDPEKFLITTEHFDGPLELLIELVEKRKLLINDISLAAVTDEYMARVSQMQEQSLPNTAQFVALAATLLLIKSKSLLPVLELTEEEEASIEDLEDRLKQYQLYRDIADTIKQDFGESTLYTSQYAAPAEALFVPDKYCTTGELSFALERVLHALPKETPKLKAKVRPTVSLEEMIDRLHTRIEKQMSLRFSEIQHRETEPRNVIVSFLAVLELFKQGRVIVSQHTQFADIHIELEQGSTPRYY